MQMKKNPDMSHTGKWSNKDGTDEGINSRCQQRQCFGENWTALSLKSLLWQHVVQDFNFDSQFTVECFETE